MQTTKLSALVAGFTRDEQPASDAELLGRFVAGRDEAAFAELVRRHGAMVFGACRRVLGNHHLAEDAFQAVFVVLARSASRVRPTGAVGGWLHGVAWRTAMRARTMTNRRKHHEARAASPSEPLTSPQEPDWDKPDAVAVLDEEIATLPAQHRDAVVLCELEGRSRADAATQLGIPMGTLSSRLAAARKLLAARLRTRGVTLPATGLVAFTLPSELTARATAACAGPVPIEVATLADGVMRTMFLSRYKITAMALVALVVFGTGAVLATGLFDASPPDEAPPPRLPGTANPPPKVRDKADPKKPKVDPEGLKARDLKRLQGKWVVIREIYGNTLQKGDRGNWVFKGDKVIVNDRIEGTFTIDASTRPRQLLRKFTDAEKRQRTLAYIYTFDEDHLLLSGTYQFFDEDVPPRDFGDNRNFMRLERRDD